MQGPSISYKNIAGAIEFYEKAGYKYIEVPWLVSKESIDVTRPEKSRPFETFAGNLVASGEQSFIEIIGHLCPGRKYMCATPCFRDETYNEWHLQSFFKVELIIPLWKDDDPKEFLNSVINCARSFFTRYRTVSVIETDIGHDIIMDNIELGSYGIRQYQDSRWVYGTGVAEPRLSQVMERCYARMDKELEDLCN